MNKAFKEVILELEKQRDDIGNVIKSLEQFIPGISKAYISKNKQSPVQTVRQVRLVKGEHAESKIIKEKIILSLSPNV